MRLDRVICLRVICRVPIAQFQPNATHHEESEPRSERGRRFVVFFQVTKKQFSSSVTETIFMSAEAPPLWAVTSDPILRQRLDAFEAACAENLLKETAELQCCEYRKHVNAHATTPEPRSVGRLQIHACMQALPTMQQTMQQMPPSTCKSY